MNKLELCSNIEISLENINVSEIVNGVNYPGTTECS